jgi:hypothetical protein
MKPVRISMQQMHDEYQAFKAREVKPGEHVFYSGHMDPLVRWAQQEHDSLNADIEAAGGIEAWRKARQASASVAQTA